MQREFARPLPRLLGVTLVLALLVALANAGPASADPLVDQTRAKYEKVRTEVRDLDNRVELLTERYDAAVSELAQLRIEIRDANRRLKAAEIHLTFEQGVLANLMVARYKGLDASTLDIVLGASSLSQVTGDMDIKQRFDAAVADAVNQIRITRDAIVTERLQLLDARDKARTQKHIIETKRAAIRKMLTRRRALMLVLGDQVRIAEAATSIGQTKLALAAAQWIRADMRINHSDPGAELRDQVALEGLAQIGVPYKWGGASPETGFDCSGLVMWLWAQHGVALPHFAASQYHMGPFVAVTDLHIGDLVFFHKLGHVGIYIGNGYVLHAPHTGATVEIESFSIPWFQSTYVGATRPGPP
ncbi:MAG TPA: NlpC/P60 family protein [Gemmatimonadales bacterium]|nr:NlpC/P60 family protein [Gemmatimonadales bacterium]